ncbi:RrF2 family transcriptional regulator [Arenimonas sp. MALMAid1274]|uniref:RrF2 family transcriptional regulator n=1 Tax=Arenimonas sp. MALMAid1274 TaxID=3411630 RepID=UPI003B9E97AF
MKAKYALRALSLLAQHLPGQLQARRIAQDASVPAKFLEAILVELRNAGLVESRRGIQGGHRLARDPETLTVGEVVRVVDGPIAPIRCASLTAYRPCDDCPDPGRCAVRLLMGEVREAMSQVIDRRSLAQFARDSALLARPDPQSDPTPEEAPWIPASP